MGNKEIFYHYCSVDVLLSILKNDVLRLSDIEKSNDYSEKKWMMNKIKKEFIDIVNQEKLVSKKENLIEGFSHNVEKFDILSNVYASCFSTDGDLLSQWRAYAQDGYGVAIGFSGELLKKVNEYDYGIKFSPIIYDLEKQKEYGLAQAKKIFDLMLTGDFLFHAMSEVFENDLESLCYYKNPAFSEEREWRLCISVSPECRRDAKAYYDPFVMSEIKLYSNQREIVTYLELDYSEVKNEVVKEIILGPKCKISFKDLKQILFILGYETSGIEIKRSEATYM